MNFIEAPLAIGLIAYFIYKTFELFARKQERLNLIEKIGQNFVPSDPSLLKLDFGSLLPSFQKKSFYSLRIGCLLAGLGLGLLAGLFLCLYMKSAYSLGNSSWEQNNYFSVAYGSLVLLFGGTGLLVSYFIESKSTKKD